MLGSSIDLQDIYPYINKIIGKKCWNIAYTYGEELSFHFGKHLAYNSPAMKGKKHGEYRLNTRASKWKLFTPYGIITCKNKKDKLWISRILVGLIGREKIKSIDFTFPNNNLIITFSNDCLFQIIPLKNSGGLADWNLMMPDHFIEFFGDHQTIFDLKKGK